MTKTVKICGNAVLLFKYYRSIGLSVEDAIVRQSGYFDNAIRDRQDNVLKEATHP